jgi:hypothetical protein
MPYRQWFFLTETNGIQAFPFKGNHQKIFPGFKLRPFEAESIQNPKSFD